MLRIFQWSGPALPQDASGKGYYDGVGTNKSLTSFSSVLGQLDQLQASGTPFRSGGSASNLAAAAQQLKGMSTADGPDGGRNGCVYAVNKVFKRAGITPPWGSSLYVPDAEAKMQQAGWQQVPYNQMQPGDIFVMKDQQSPPQAHIGVATSNKMILSNSSGKAKMSWEATAQGYNSYYGGQGALYRMPGSTSVNNTNGGTPGQPAGGQTTAQQMLQAAGMPALAAAAGPIASPPGPVPAAPANANNGVPMMATSAQISMGQMAPAGGLQLLSTTITRKQVVVELKLDSPTLHLLLVAWRAQEQHYSNNLDWQHHNGRIKPIYRLFIKERYHRTSRYRC